MYEKKQIIRNKTTILNPVNLSFSFLKIFLDNAFKKSKNIITSTNQFICGGNKFNLSSQFPKKQIKRIIATAKRLDLRTITPSKIDNKMNMMLKSLSAMVLQNAKLNTNTDTTKNKIDL